MLRQMGDLRGELLFRERVYSQKTCLQDRKENEEVLGLRFFKGPYHFTNLLSVSQILEFSKREGLLSSEVPS